MNNQKGFATIALVIIIVLIAGVAGYFVVKKVGINFGYSPSPTETAKDETAGWKTYTNDEFGFVIKYPVSYPTFQSGRYPTKTGEQILISIGNGDVFGIFINTNTTLENQLQIQRKIFGSYIVNEKQIKFAGQSAHEIITTNTPDLMRVILFSHPIRIDTVFSIRLSNLFPKNFSDQILPTFKFTK